MPIWEWAGDSFCRLGMQINSGDKKTCNWYVSDILLYLSVKKNLEYTKCEGYQKEDMMEQCVLLFVFQNAPCMG